MDTVCVWYTDIHADKTPILIKNKTKLENEKQNKPKQVEGNTKDEVGINEIEKGKQ